MINYAILPCVLPDDGFKQLQQVLRRAEHEWVNVNDLGFRWRAPVDSNWLGYLLDPDVRSMIASSLCLRGNTVQAMRPMYFDSVIRSGGDNSGLGVHNDLCAVEEDRQIAVVYFCNKTWQHGWGGELVLHDNCDDEGDVGRDDEVSIVIPPIPNTMVVFQVDERSYHSVLTVRGTVHRHAVVGWLNGPLKYDPHYKVPPTDPGNTVMDYGEKRLVWTPGNSIP